MSDELQKLQKLIGALDRITKATTGNLERTEQAQAELRRELDVIKARLSRVEKQQAANVPLPSAWQAVATHDMHPVLQ